MPRIPTLTAARLAVAGSFGFLVAAWIAMPWVGGDTPFVLDGSNALITCLSNHDFNACGFTGTLNSWGSCSRDAGPDCRFEVRSSVASPERQLPSSLRRS